MNIVGALIFWFAGFLSFMMAKAMKSENKDYSDLPVAEGKVLGMEDFCGDRWLVQFKNELGEEVIGMDDIASGSTFHPERYHLPCKKMQVKVYYYAREDKSRFGVNNKPVTHYIHFCDETFYDLTKKGKRNAGKICVVAGIIFIFFGAIILLQKT